ncbi:DUF2332 family protein [Galactobacter caseinivorans]|uniref:DUF2332 family protein n=1 Tax=Galactobacter caseinivorans TaxID=2676123 RepID=A0A496PK21_9MICC|nr:DUF2332 family protein [Galactobacter caseinivorans]RKW70852.1 DUF2332 family protein [Galactobacter caseinivorans]
MDLNQLDPTNEEQVSWLETLVWPKYDQRRPNTSREGR